ncbi:hypothetical protein CFC21_035931 [Triticum aestivum]|uniref:Uncharacterized protein n=3 Tax=Triticum TaxID=4564 RepID=A0A9R0RN74_TRITD|nr:uncharacterized protein LOC119268786 [Triticum dicoccoides]XP_044337149.1 uncharacterized protein LOC123058498 [Triticum aestivum]XP_048568068.1 uncharacterized protein LOC125548531 [Triticum urartu]KAF7023420.1 hypothetical protein CFC21_035931 [Triticum aestivum]VAH63148.1 unnamed protein product [Triticum turgidum subsp. durum]
MGNFASCTLARIPGAAKGARVVLPDGGLRLVRPPATAAELMLEAPGHFLADARALQAGRRIEALAADEDLELGGVYAAFPMKRLGSKAAPADVARLAAVFAREAHGRRPASAKVAAIVVAPPEAASVAAEADLAPVRAPRLDEMAVDDEAAAAEIGELKQRISGGRLSRRRPTLETIHEESYAALAC